MAKHPRIPAVLALGATALTLGACGHNPGGFGPTAQLSEKECMARVMYFESNRSSDEGMIAVGTVVMNRLQSPKYPKSVCGVVGQNNQFAEGALTKHVNKRHSSWARAERAADAVLAGERHAGVGAAMFFHTAGYSFPYRNMKYVTLAGGNIFYDKRYPAPGAPAWPSASTFARNFGAPEKAAPIMVAEAKPEARPEPVALASKASARPPMPVVLASATSARIAGPSRAATPASLAAKPLPEKPKQVQVAAARPSPKARPIVLAMLDAKPRSGAPRSIADLIEMDTRRR